ncbi:dihydroneopterin aldolase [Nitrospira sp. Kam-Ns4a]
MINQIVIERLEFQAQCGTTVHERQAPQPVAVDLELDCDRGSSARADDLADTVDYERVAQRVVEVGTAREFRLLETLAEEVSRALFAEFPVLRLRLWVRKVVPPVPQVQGSVGVRLDRTRPALPAEPQPAPFLLDQWHRLPKGEALDVASGAGRHTLYLARHGYAVDAVDRDAEALAALAARARDLHLTSVTVRQVDLEADPVHPPELGRDRYDVILVFFYLYRPLMPALMQALRPGGVLLYETFLLENHLRYQHPRRREFCLAPNELLELTRGLRVLHYEEGPQEQEAGARPAFTARLLAQREGSCGNLSHFQSHGAPVPG